MEAPLDYFPERLIQKRPVAPEARPVVFYKE